LALALRGKSSATGGRILGARCAEVRGGSSVIILGLILLVIGFIAKISILWTIGIILLVIGAILWVLGATGRAVGGRRHYW
jgi:hypothetical protein